MNLLLDTNIFLEALLCQEQSASSLALLRNEGAHNLNMTDFSLHSIGVLLFRRGIMRAYADFIADIKAMAIQVLALEPFDGSVLTDVALRFSLDFDDAYQYEVARRFQLTLITFDSDFDKVDIPHMIPGKFLLSQ